MRLHQVSARWLAAVSVAVLAIGASALAQPATTYEPKVMQPGKDVVWVPTPQALVDKMLDMAKVTPSDYLVDLGSGDGRTVITAARRGSKAHGIEYNPDMVELAKRNAVEAGVTDKATFVKADIFESDFSQATVVTLFLLPGLNIRLRPTLLDMKVGTRVVSNSFTMGEWEADETATVGGDCKTFCTAYLWIVPAKVGGKWRMGESELSIDQQFQIITGTLKTGNVIAPITGKLNGDKIGFTAGDTQYTGTVKDGAMEGTSKASGKEAAWQATKQ